MKVNKTQAVLFMYEHLYKYGSFTKEEIISKLDISNLTFLRYIQELRAYLYNFYSEENLVFSTTEKKYILVK